MFPLSTGVYVKLATAAFLLCISFYFGWHLRDADFTKYKAEQALETQNKEKQYQAAADKIEREKNDQIRNINSKLVDAISELRKRPSRPESPIAGQIGTGASLFAEDAIFLRREAARADELRSGLEACYAQYDALVK